MPLREERRVQPAAAGQARRIGEPPLQTRTWHTQERHDEKAQKQHREFRCCFRAVVSLDEHEVHDGCGLPCGGDDEQ